MGKIETVQDFKDFLNENREKLLDKTTKIESLPQDDEWVNDTSWDEIYAKGVSENGKL